MSLFLAQRFVRTALGHGVPRQMFGLIVTKYSSKIKISPKTKISHLFDNRRIESCSWKDIRLSFLQKTSNKDKNNVDFLVIDFCEKNNDALQNTLSYMEFLKENEIDISVKLKERVIQVYNKYSHEKSIPLEVDRKIVDLCEDLSKSVDVLSKNQLNLLLNALSMTTEWRTGRDLIEKYGVKCTDSTLTAFSLMSANAFWESEPEIGWKMLRIIVDANFFPNCISFGSYWNFCSLDKKQFVANVEKMLEFIGCYEILVSRRVLNGLKIELDNFDGSLIETKIDARGSCLKCQQELSKSKLSSLEFQLLKKEFSKVNMNIEMIEEQSSRRELYIFNQKVNSKSTFHYVIDGLNTTRIFSDSKGNIYKQSKLLAEIVEHFVKLKKKVLVIGKAHMEQWPEQSLTYIKRNATVFFTDNTSDDDIYMIYGALISGPKTNFITNDLLRTYKNRFNPEKQEIFRRWQKQHQHFITYNQQHETFHIIKPKEYKVYAHKNEQGYWHLPFVDEPLHTSPKTPSAPKCWACIKLSH